MTKTNLAVIIPVLNCLDYTKKLLSTIKTKYKYKLILINNGSTDETGVFFNKLKNQKDTTVFNFNTNYGVGPSWNLGIKIAIQKFSCNKFFIPNNDILLNENTIDLLCEAIESPKTALISARDISGEVNYPEEVINIKTENTGKTSEAPEFSCFMLKKETIKEVGFFDEKFYPAYFEDNDYHYRIRLKGKVALKLHKAVYFHFGSRTIKSNEEVRNKSNIGYMINREYFFKKWGGEPGHELYKTPFNK